MLSKVPYVVTAHKENLFLPQKNRRNAPLVAETNISDMDGARKVFQGLYNDTVAILMEN